MFWLLPLVVLVVALVVVGVTMTTAILFGVERPILSYKKSWYLKHPIKFVREFWRSVYVWPVQRARRGYSNQDRWSFDYYIAKVISAAMRDFAATTWSMPVAGAVEGINTEEDYKAALLRIADGFDAAQSIINLDYYDKPTKSEMFFDEPNDLGLLKANFVDSGDGDDNETILEKEAAAIARFDAGMDEFKRLFFHLWD